MVNALKARISKKVHTFCFYKKHLVRKNALSFEPLEMHTLQFYFLRKREPQNPGKQERKTFQMTTRRYDTHYITYYTKHIKHDTIHKREIINHTIRWNTLLKKSHITRYTSHSTYHTWYSTPQKQIAQNTSHITNHTKHITHHIKHDFLYHITCHISHFTAHHPSHYM